MLCLSFLLQGKSYIYLPSLKKDSCFGVDLPTETYGHHKKRKNIQNLLTAEALALSQKCIETHSNCLGEARILPILLALSSEKKKKKIYPEILDFSFHFCLLGEKMLWNTRKCCFLKGRIHNPCMGDKGIFNVNNQGCEKVEIYAQVSEAMTRSLWTQHWTRIYKQQSLGEILTICLRKAFIRQGKTSN